MRNNPGIAQTNLLCCAKSAFFAPRSNLKETQTFLTFCKLADCLPELRELRVVPGCKYAYASFVKQEGVAQTQHKVYLVRMQTRNDPQLPSLANSSLACEDRTKGGESAKRGRRLSCANPGFAVHSCDPKFAQENPRMVRIRTLRITYTS